MGILRNIPDFSSRPKTTSGGRGGGARSAVSRPPVVGSLWSAVRKEWNFPYRFRSAFRGAESLAGGGKSRLVKHCLKDRRGSRALLKTRNSFAKGK